ncbi:MAG: DUF2442 domain-containing protein [Bacteroidia bacterium]|nr:DUF2442 domain-containing protein [Bacteroidia bacterium]
MNPRVKSIVPKADYLLEVIFNNEERKIFDLKPYLNLGAFSELKDFQLFNTATEKCGTVVWSNGLDICPDTLYIESR